MENRKFDLNDIVIVPAEESDITTRSECDPIYSFNGYRALPLMAAPMDTVVSETNYGDYLINNIIPCIPRGVHNVNRWYSKYCFQSFGLAEIEKSLELYKLANRIEYFSSPNDFFHYPNILIDIANGHMKKLIPLIQEIKKIWPDIVIMVGNVANPETFSNLAMAGADYVRISIGTGAGCTTAANVSINYPMGSLISECCDQKIRLGLWNTHIVADGGMKNYADIIKCLALGADYVMIGSIFNKAIESAGFNYLWGKKISQKWAEILWKYGFPVKKKYRGMSTKEVQRSWGRSRLVTAEGITKYQKVEYSIYQWTENFSDYLKSAMSYSNAKKLSDFKGNAQYVFITDAARRRFEK